MPVSSRDQLTRARTPARALFLSMVVSVLVAFPGLAQADDPQFIGRLRSGQALFWMGEYVRGPPDALAAATAGSCSEQRPCYRFAFEVLESADRLPVAINVPMRDDAFTLGLVDPSGREVAEATNDELYVAEVFVRGPAVGTWTVEVTSVDATDSAFRMRAGLEEIPPKPSKPHLLAPNLKVNPPYEFGFVAPANPFNAMYPSDDVNPPLAVGPVHPISCAVDETAEDGVTKCLRFSAGPMNAGDGPFQLRLAENNQVFQMLYSTDGSIRERPAGTHEFHKTHGHEHYTNVLTYELFEVVNRHLGRMVPASKGTKSGFCPSDQNFAEWTSFVQEPAFTADSDCSRFIGLSRGWGDVYRRQRPGQYVDFGDNGDGIYVVRATVDANGWVKETNEDDNTGYAFIKIKGEDVKLLERGCGDSPWDPNKVVIRDWWDRLTPTERE